MAQVQREPKGPMPPQQQQKPGLDSAMTPRPNYQAPLYRGSGKLQDKVALITGGDSGIGRSVAVLYGREGADVAIVYLPAEQSDAEETKQAVEKEGRKCLLLPGDVTEPKFCQQAVERTVQEFGKLDILVNNAAYQQERKRLEDITEEQFDLTFRTNIYGYFYLVKASLPQLKAGSAIINCGSVAGLQGNPKLLDYAATKGAIISFTRTLGVEWARHNIQVNCIAPGWFDTEMSAPAWRDERVAQRLVGDIPARRIGRPEEIGPLAVYLASAASDFMTGQTLYLDGGHTAA